MNQTSSERPSLLFSCYKYHQPIEGSFIEKEGWELRSRSEIEPKKGKKSPRNSPNVTVKKQCAFFLNITPKRRLGLEKKSLCHTKAGCGVKNCHNTTCNQKEG